MKRSILFAIALLTVLALCACTTCPVPPSAPRTYLLKTPQGEGTQR
ncbi:MAG: hypothetical protein GXX82_13945 [Syntrophorhabdus sp.]|nr:hypothetical protein [Syntrophorhabdus sp.]